ncbi:MAG TPA: hypothetical protein PLU72_20095 [Candidatus Ozemobacteraceae bacterium]|nr:hypothetical protein [Candidatus Ozemobacteraceae bacterium]
MKLRHSVVHILVFTLILGAAAFAMTTGEKAAVDTVRREVASILGSKSDFARPLGNISDYQADLQGILRKYPVLNEPRQVLLEGRPVKVLVPLLMSEQEIGGFFQVSPDGSTILSWPAWDKDLKPIFRLSRADWEKAPDANALPQLAELIPVKPDHSAGVPVEISDLEDVYLIDHLECIPPKTQEERKVYTEQEGLAGALGRRTGSSKCISYAVSMASDWWKSVLGLPIGKYVSFVNGTLEYGMNPRLIESLYYSVPSTPYSWKLFTGKDRVTGEKIAYSPKHFAYIVSSIPLPKDVPDPIRKGVRYPLPAEGFGMDKPFYPVFDHHRGDVKTIRLGLERYGILFAQHTMRFLNDKLSSPLGVHGVNIVGTARLKGKDVVLYYETFGKNHRDYIEDSFYGPRLRAFPVQFFYQGLAFPHHLRVAMEARGDGLSVRFTDCLGRPAVPDRMSVERDGTPVAVKAASELRFPAFNGKGVLKLRFEKKYFYAPEEDGAYERTWFFGKNGCIELKEYEKLVTALHVNKQNIVEKIRYKPENFYDYLVGREEALRKELLPIVRKLPSDPELARAVADEFRRNGVLAKSPLGRECKELLTFSETQTVR